MDTQFQLLPVTIQLNRKQRLALRGIVRELHKKPASIPSWLWQSLLFGGPMEIDDWAQGAISDACGYSVSEVLRAAE